MLHLLHRSLINTISRPLKPPQQSPSQEATTSSPSHTPPRSLLLPLPTQSPSYNSTSLWTTAPPGPTEWYSRTDPKYTRCSLSRCLISRLPLVYDHPSVGRVGRSHDRERQPTPRRNSRLRRWRLEDEGNYRLGDLTSIRSCEWINKWHFVGKILVVSVVLQYCW